MIKFKHSIQCVDTHTGGEALRIITAGFPKIPGKTILDKRKYVLENLDHIRKLLMLEPRGHTGMYGAILTDRVTEDGDFAVLFTHNEGLSSMCGHAVISLTKTAIELSWIEYKEGINEVKFDVPAGRITAFAEVKDDVVARVYFQNVPCFVYQQDIKIDLKNYGTVTADIVYCVASTEITFDYYLITFKKNMLDPSCYGKAEFNFDSGFFCVIKPGQIHQWNVEKQWSGYHIFVAPALLQEFKIDFSFFNYQLNEALLLSEDEKLKVETLFSQIKDEYEKEDCYLDLLMAYCNLLLTYVQKCYIRQFSEDQPVLNKTVLDFRKLLARFYEENNNQLPSVNYFAEKMNLSTNYFSDLIKQKTGKTATEIIHEKIIATAKEELKNSSKNISEIAYNLGFEYPTYFGRLFKRYTDQSPLKYRETKTATFPLS